MAKKQLPAKMDVKGLNRLLGETRKAGRNQAISVQQALKRAGVTNLHVMIPRGDTPAKRRGK